MSTFHFVFYANASSSIGAGHVMRLYAIAQVCVKRGINVSFACCECPDYLREKVQQAGCNYVQLPTNFNASDIKSLNANVLFIDDYNISEHQWAFFIASGALLVNIDDNTHTQELLSDIIINPAVNADKSLYEKRAPKATLCLGSQFTLLRQEFMQQAFTPVEQRAHILITLGGADVKNMSYALALSLLKRVTSNTQISLLLGGLQTSSTKALHGLSEQYGNLQLIEQSSNVAHLMMRSGLAISAAGGTLAELASMGTPSIALVSVDNQKAILSAPDTHKWCEVFDVRQYKGSAEKDENRETDKSNTHFENLAASKSVANTHIIEEISAQSSELWLDLCKRKRMSDHARQLIDGKGCERILEQILNAL